MSFFYTSLARRSANILTAQCLDRGLDVVQAHPDGTITAEIAGDYYTLGWDVAAQEPVLLALELGEVVYVA